MTRSSGTPRTRDYESPLTENDITRLFREGKHDEIEEWFLTSSTGALADSVESLDLAFRYADLLLKQNEQRALSRFVRAYKSRFPGDPLVAMFDAYFRVRIDFLQGLYRNARTTVERALEDAKAMKDPAPEIWLGRLHLVKGYVEERDQHLDAARIEFEEARRHFDAAGSRIDAASCLLMLGTCDKATYDWPRAEESMRAALQVYIDENSDLEMVARNNLGVLLSFLGRHEEATVALEAATKLAEAAGNNRRVPLYKAGLGLAHLRHGDTKNARRVLERGLEQAKAGALVRAIRLMHEYLAELSLATQRPAEAEAHIEAALSPIGESEPEPDIVIEVLCRRAELELVRRHDKKALADAEQAIKLAETNNLSRYERAVAQRIRGQILQVMGRDVEAHKTLDESQRFLAKIGETFERARVEFLLNLPRGKEHAVRDIRTAPVPRPERTPGTQPVHKPFRSGSLDSVHELSG